MTPSDRIDAIEAALKSAIKDLAGFGKWQVQDVESEVDSIRNALEETMDDMDRLRGDVDDAIDAAKGDEE